MAKFKFKIDRPSLARLTTRVSREAALNAGMVTVERARGYLSSGDHNRTGNLSNSLEAKVLSSGPEGTTVSVGSELDYAGFAEKGRGPVRAKPGKFLVFMPKGSSTLVFAKEVKAAEGIRFLERALDDLQQSDFGT